MRCKNANKPSQLSSDGVIDAQNRVVSMGVLGVTVKAKIIFLDFKDDKNEGHECHGSH